MIEISKLFNMQKIHTTAYHLIANVSNPKTAEEAIEFIGELSATDESTDESDSQPVKRKFGDPPHSLRIEKHSRPKPTEGELDGDYVQSADSDTDKEIDDGKVTKEDVASSSKRWRCANVANTNFSKKVEVKRRRVAMSENAEPKKKSSTSYFMPVNGTDVQVCEKFFRKTMDISFKPIAKAHENKTETNQYSAIDKCGKHPPHN
uniref:Uncharacterized protein n=1 Tax=Romanomermis culicivorax TaxID=13658 RepID=A0A915JZR1_ROMCU